MIAADLEVHYAYLEDLNEVVKLHSICLPPEEHFAMRFGKKFMCKVYEWFIISDKAFVLVVKKKDTIIGLTAISFVPYNLEILKYGFRYFIIGLIRRPWLIFNPVLVNRVKSIILKRDNKSLVDSRTAYIAFTAVSSEYRGKDIGTLLRERTKEICKAKNFSYLLVGLRNNNFKAKSMNEKVGFQEVPELRSDPFIYMKLIL